MRRSSKSVRIERELRKFIAGVGPGSKLPTVRDLMAKYRASQSTVTGALDRLEHQHLLTRKQGSGLYAAAHPTMGRTLILLDGDAALSPSPFYTMLLDALLEVYEATVDTVEVYIVPPTVSRQEVPDAEALPDQLVSRLRARLYPACIAINIRESLIGAIRAAGCPTVGFACLADAMVNLDGDSTGVLAVQALSQLGCLTAAFMSQSTPTQVMRYRRLCAEQGIEVIRVPSNSGGVHTQIQEIRSSDRIAYAYEETRRLLDHRVPEGIVVLDDVHSLGAFMAIEERGLRIGRDIQAVTWWNLESPLLLGWATRVARLELDVQQLARLLKIGADAAVRGELPTEGDWEHAVEIVGPTQTSLVTTIAPVLRLKCSDTQ